MCPPGYRHNGFMANHALGHMMLVPMKQRVLNKLSKERNVSDHKGSTKHRVLNTYVLHIYYAHLAIVRFEHSVRRGQS